MNNKQESVNPFLNNRYSVISSYRGNASDMSNIQQNPKLSKPTPTDKDYETGSIKRFFVQKNTSENFPIVEVDIVQFQDFLTNSFFKTALILWRISGEVESSGTKEDYMMGVREYNQNSINNVKSKMNQIELVLNNPLEFYKKI